MKEDTRHIKATPLASRCLHQEATEILLGTFLLVFKLFYDQRVCTFNSTVQRRYRLRPHRNRAPDRSYPDSQTSELVRGAFASLLSCLIYSVRSREKKVSKRKQKKRRAGKVLSPGGYRPIYYRGYIVDKQIVILFIRMNEKKWLKKYCSNI